MRRTSLVWLLALGGAACDPTFDNPDAFSPDASIFDGGGIFPPDAPNPFGTVTVKVFDQNGQPLSGAFVVVQRFDSFDSQTSTNGEGVATVNINTGDTVTAAYSFQTKGTERRLISWINVEPGDVLQLGEPRRAGGNVIGTMTVTGPGSFAGAAHYEATSSCFESASSTGTGPLSYELHDGCHGDPTKIPVWLQAFDASGASIAYAAAAQVPITGGAAAASFDAWRTDTLSFTSTIAHLPASGVTVSRHLGLLSPGGEIFELGVSGSPGSASARVPVGLTPTWVYADEVAEATPNLSRWRIIGGSSPIQSSVALDYATGLPASIDTLTYDTPQPSSFGAIWTYRNDGSIANQAVVVTHSLLLNGFGTWTLVAPPGTTFVRIPQLPESMSEYRPAELPSSTTIVTIQSNNAEYRQLRRVLTGAGTDGNGLWPVVTAPLGSGTVRLSERVFFQ